MQRTDLALALGGNLTYVKYTIPYTDLTATAGLVQTTTLLANPGSGGTATFQIPQGGVAMGVKVHPTVAFAGPSISAATISVGVTGSVTGLTSAYDVFQAVTATVVQETAMFKSTSISAIAVTYTFTVVGANLTVLTAGSVDVYICYLNVSTPSA